MDYLMNICGKVLAVHQASFADSPGWASDYGFYIILDLHGAPFAQVGSNADTGQLAAAPTDSNPDFYQASQYQRALWFLGNLTETVHNNGGSTGAMRNVGMIEVVNEPIQVSRSSRLGGRYLTERGM